MNGQQLVKIFPSKFSLQYFSYEDYCKFVKILLVKFHAYLINSSKFYLIKLLHYTVLD